jgi:short-subunit dehydrogenase
LVHFQDAAGHTGVTVTALCPGPTASGFQKRASMEDSKLVAGKIADAASVARAGYDGLRKGHAIVIPGTRNRLLAFSVRLFPRGAVTKIVRRGQERVRAG